MKINRIKPFHACVITLYPEMFPGSLGISLAGRAHDNGLWHLETVFLREFGLGKHRKVDDPPGGGGAGMVLRPDVLAEAIDYAEKSTPDCPKLLMSPRGRLLDQTYVRKLAKEPGVIIVCGRFEGVDERIIESRNLQEVSIGDYVLSGGEPAAIVMLDTIVRLIPGVMGNIASGNCESHESGLLEYPHYTKPNIFEEEEIPAVLLSGNHQKIMHWQKEQAEKITQKRRPDLMKKYNRKKSPDS